MISIPDIGKLKDPDILIGHSTTESCISKIIRWVTRSKFTSHSWISFWARGVRLVVGADEDGALTWIPWHKFAKENKIPAVFAPQHQGLDVAVTTIVSKHGGHDYDYGAAGLTAIRSRWPWLWRKYGTWLKEVITDPYDAMCAEIIVRLFREVQCPVIGMLDPESTNAQTLLDVKLKNQELFKPIYLAKELL